MQNPLLAAFAVFAFSIPHPVQADFPATIKVERFFNPESVQIDKPVWFGSLPGKPGVFVVLEQHKGRISIIRQVDGKWARQDFLTLNVHQEGECGLLGIAFHPGFTGNRKYYLNFNPAVGALATVVEEREADATFFRDSGKSGRQILRLPQPYINHNGGTLAFGPKDGYLYIGMGDGGDSRPAQDLGALFGKMLRLDVDGQEAGRPYRIPADNPFVGQAGAKGEIWAYGLRNPWKWSFDAPTGNLWVGDVGETTREEITLVGKGANLGWAIREGSACRNGEPDCPASAAAGMLDPVLDLGRAQSVTIIGGLVYRGNPHSPFYGVYFFADYLLRTIYALRQEPGKPPEYKHLATAPARISSFGSDQDGNLFVVGHDNGAIYKLASPDLDHTGIHPARKPAFRSGRLISVRRGHPWRLPGAQGLGGVEIVSPAGLAIARFPVIHGQMPTLEFPPGIYFVRSLHASADAWTPLLLH